MRLTIAGGGTGGHLYPGLAVAAALAGLDPECRVRFIGTRKGLESRVVPERGYPIDYISIGGFLGKGPFEKARFPARMALSTAQSLGHLRRNRPDAVLGTGGYVSAPPVLAARMLGIPVALLALDAMPSKAVRMMAGLAREIYAGFPECADHLRNGEKVAYTGNPLRPGVGERTREEGCREFGLSPEKRTVLAYGGSRGAHKINIVMTESILRQGGKWKDLQFIVQTGKDDLDMVRGRLKGAPAKTAVLPYIEKMELAFAASDLVISRSGSTVSEILACGLPSILVPYPHAASNHQEHNARSLESRGAAMVIKDLELDIAKLSGAIERILSEPKLLSGMKESARTLARPGASREVAKRLMEMASR